MHNKGIKMSFGNFTKTEKWVNLKKAYRGFGYSLVITLFVGLLVGFLSQPELETAQWWENMGFWIVRLLIGYFAHVAVLIVFLLKNWLPPEKTVLGMLPAIIGGGVLTFVVMSFFVGQIVLNWKIGVVLLGNVAAISVIVQVFLYPIQCYDLLLELQKERKLNQLKKAEKQPGADFILLETKDKEVIKIHYDDLFMITINDHYLNYYYSTKDQVAQIMLYGRLKDVEDRLQNILIKVNRSTLVNPKKIVKFKEGEKGIIYIQGIEEAVFVPKTRLQEIRLRFTPN